MFGVIITIILLLRPSKIWCFCLAVAVPATIVGLLFEYYYNKKLSGFKVHAKSFLLALGASALFFLFNRWSSLHGLLGLLIYVVLIAGYKMYKQKEFLGNAKARLEVMIFGFPARKRWREDLGFTSEKISAIKKSKKNAKNLRRRLRR